MSTAEAEIQSILRWSPVGCMAVTSGVIKAVNAEAVAALASSPGHLVGASLESLVIDEHRPQVAALISHPPQTTAAMEVRTRHDLQPVELVYRPGPGGLSNAIVVVRSLLREYRLSALAGAELTHDQGTGLPNRLYLLSQLNERIMSPRTRPLAVVCIWVDDLAGLQATRGEHAVSRVMREVATRMTRRLRGPDLLGKLDESGFLALLNSEATPDQIADIGQRLRDEVAFPVDFNDTLISFTASVAVTTIGHERPTLQEAVAAVEGAGSRAKSSEGNHTEVFAIDTPAKKTST